MRLCGGSVPVLSGTILLLLFNFDKIVQGHCWEKKFYYKLPHSNNCGICRICPPEIAKNPSKLEKYVKKECMKYTLPDGRIPHCHSTHFETPSCEEWKPHVGTVECDMNNTVYSSCHLVCPHGYKLSHSSNVTCKPNLKWNQSFPYCLAKKSRVPNHHKKLHVGAIICIVLVSVALCPTLIGIVVFRVRNRRARADREQASMPPGQVIISLTNAEKRISKQRKPKWIVKRGSTVSVSAESQSADVQCLVFVKTGSKLKREMGPVFTNIPGGPTQIVLGNIQQYHHGKYSWIAKLSDGTNERGTFKISVIEPAVFKDKNSGFCENNNEDASMNPVGEKACVPKATQMKPNNDTAILISTAIEDEELAQNAGSIPTSARDSGFKRLMQNRQDVQSLCILLDREEREDKISWHHIAMSDLLGYDTDTVAFLEYHLKGKLYKGPMSYILTLMRQQGTTVTEFVELLKEYEPSSNKAISILEKYL